MFKIILKTMVSFSAAAIFMGAMLPIQSAKASSWDEPPQWCGSENSQCFPAPDVLRDAYYCGGGKCNHKVVSGWFFCNNATFGDPNPGTSKACYIGDANYTYKYPEWQNPTSTPVIMEPEPVVVAFGDLQNPVWATKVLGTGNCDNSTFGYSGVGISRSCYASPKFTYCSEGNLQCQVNGGLYTITLAAFGPYGGPFLYKVVTGSFTCIGATFGVPMQTTNQKCFVKTS